MKIASLIRIKSKAIVSVDSVPVKNADMARYSVDSASNYTNVEDSQFELLDQLDARL